MKFVVYDRNTGNVLRMGQCSTLVYKIQADRSLGELLYEGDDKAEVTNEDRIDPVTNTRIIGGNRLVADGLPTEPGLQWLDGRWAYPDLPTAVAGKKQVIERHRDAQQYGVIEYAGHTWDARRWTQFAMLQKLVELDDPATEPYPGLLQWRDAANKTHTFADAPAMARWLRGLIGACARRRTEMYQQSWKAKEVLKRLDHPDKVAAFDHRSVGKK